MATTIDSAFAKLKSDVEITGLQTSTVSTRQANVRDVMESELEVIDSFLRGSYARDTLVAPLSEADVDIFVVLSSKYFHQYNGRNGGQAGLLDLVKRTLKKTYTRTPDVARNGQAVTIRFEDFLVDVVPGFKREGGGYLIPNSITQSWISTDPKRHVDISRAANAAHNGDLIPLIKMIKAWNKNIDWYFRSFHLEVLAWTIDCYGDSESVLTKKLKDLSEQKDKLNRDSPQPPKWAYGIAKRGIAAGEADYKVDKNEDLPVSSQ